MPIGIAALGIALIVAEEVSLQIYLNTPCPTDNLCDKVVGRNYWGGIMLIITAGVVFGVELVIRPAKATQPSTP